MTLAALVLASGCSESKPPANGAAVSSVDAAASSAPAAASRPATVQRSLLLEGAPAPMVFTLYETAAAPSAPGFSTYLPSDMVAEPGADGLRFVAQFGGQRQPLAYLTLRWLAVGTTLADAVASMAAAAPAGAALQAVAEDARRHRWSLTEQDIAYLAAGQGRMAGSVLLGRHGDRLFTLAMHYPVEYADGFMPRAQRILDEWRWQDSGKGL